MLTTSPVLSTHLTRDIPYMASLTDTHSAPLPAALDLDAVFAAGTQASTAEPQPVHPIAARQRENDPRIMAFDAFRAARPHSALDAAGRMRYKYLSTAASRARALLARHPALAAWYAKREALAAMGMDVSRAGPSPLSAAGRAAERAQAEQERLAVEREHVYLMTCQLPDPTLVRVGERSEDAAADRQAVATERKRIESYRREQARIEARQRASAATLDDPVATAGQRRLARMDMTWPARVSEDELFMALEGLTVRCHRHTQNVPMIRRRHRAGS